MGSTARRAKLSYKIAILSDLHLGEKPKDPRYGLFLETLNKFLTSDLNELILMGDVFDILIGNKSFWKKVHPEFFSILEKIKDSNKKLTWIQGNHDFQLSKLLKPYNVEWVEDWAILEREKVKLYVSHGDLADESNKLHPIWRSFLHSKLLAAFIFLVPNAIAEKFLYPLTLKISRKSRKQSQTYSNEKARSLFRNYAQKIAHKFKSDIILLGHSHISDSLSVGENSHYLNLGSWFEEALIGEITILDSSFDIKVSPLRTWLPSPLT